MIFKALRPVIVKEFRQVRRDPTSLGMLLFLPAFLIILVGYALNFDVRHIPMAVLDESNTAQSRDFLKTFKQTEYFDHRYTIYSYDEAEELFAHSKAVVAIVIPTKFAEDVLAGRDAHVQILIDGSDNTKAAQALGYAAGLTSSYSGKLLTQMLERKGIQQYVPIDFRPRVWYNPDLISSKFLVPGLIGSILMLTAVVSTSLTVVREKERGTMEQIMVSPLRPYQVILGKTIPYMIIGLGTATVILLLGYMLFDVQIRGSLLLLYGAVFVLLLGALGQGLLISTVTNSQQVAFMLSIFSSLLPSFMLSGFIFPISNMPIALQILSNIAVNKFFLIIVRGIMLKGVGVLELWDQFVYMGIFALVTLGISSMRMQKRSL
ncbi:MAG TPA: ABC transporter permease [Bacteroidota bacterium]|jgi:ABC-2 type transport system permease protein|nr:ABC transporter permease [Bacteroidota bacterium]